MVDIHVEPHADCVGRDKEVDFARLVKRDLRIARARAQCAHDDGSAPALPPDEFRDRIDLGRGKGDDRGTRRQARDLLLSRVGQDRHARPGHHVDARNQPFKQGARGRRAEQERFLAPTHIEQAVGEHMAALEIGGELHLKGNAALKMLVLTRNEIKDEGAMALGWDNAKWDCEAPAPCSGSAMRSGSPPKPASSR